jgi:hypothetical protein
LKRLAAALAAALIALFYVGTAGVVFYAGYARAGIIMSPNDNMGPGMGPVVNESLIPAPATGFTTSRQLAIPCQTTNPLYCWGLEPTQYSDVGDFRTICAYSHMLFDDPLVWPGQPRKSHLHVFFGNTSTNANSTTTTLGAAPSTCHGGTDNRSSYWVPALVDTRTGKPMQPIENLIYYKSDKWDFNPIPTSLAAVPQGLRMIAGSAMGNPTTPSTGYDYKCNGNLPSYSSLPSCAAGAQLWMNLSFPRCWDGVNHDSANHKDHMAFPSAGACPGTHPVKLPHIAYVIKYQIPEANMGPYLRLSSDMYADNLAGGYSFHGDYIMQWKPEVMQQIMDGCINAYRDCHADALGNAPSPGAPAGYMLY